MNEKFSVSDVSEVKLSVKTDSANLQLWESNFKMIIVRHNKNLLNIKIFQSTTSPAINLIQS